MVCIRNEHMTEKPILYLDMDGPLVDFDSGVAHCTSYDHKERTMNCQGFFLSLPPTEGAVKACEWIIQYFETFILTTTPWDNPFSGMEKRLWVDEHLPKYFYKRLITSHFKNLAIGDYLVDDRTKNGAGEFSGKLIQFGQPGFENWDKVIAFLKKELTAKGIEYNV
jgi:5'-nucleotidase